MSLEHDYSELLTGSGKRTTASFEDTTFKNIFTHEYSPLAHFIECYFNLLLKQLINVDKISQEFKAFNNPNELLNRCFLN